MTPAPHLTVYGPTTLIQGDQILPLGSVKLRAALCYLALSAGPVTREALSWMLWTHAGRRNLRQLLYQIRQLPGADDWLVTTSESVEVRLLCPGFPAHGVPLPDPIPEGEPLFGLDDAGTDAFCDWVLTTRDPLADERDAVRVDRASRWVDSDPETCLSLLLPLLEAASPRLDAVSTALRAYAVTGQTDRSRALWDRVAERVSQLPSADRTEWAALRLDRTSTMGHSIQAILPDLRRLVELEPDPPPPTVIARVLEVDLLDVAVAWSQITPSSTPTTDVGMSALRARLAQALEEHGDARRAAHHWHELGEVRRAADLWWRAGVVEDDLDALIHCARTSPDHEQSEDAWCLAAIGYRLRRELDVASRTVRDMLRDANTTQRTRFLARARLQQASLGMWRGDTDAFAFARTELDALVDSDPTLAPLIDLLDGTQKTVHRQPEAAIPLLERALGVGRVEDMQALLALGACYGQTGQIDAATAAHRRGLVRARALQTSRIAAAFLIGLSATADRASAPRQARGYLLELLDLADHLDGPFMDLGRCNLATVDMTLGDLASAREQLGMVLDNAPNPSVRALVFRTRSELERVCGRYAESAAWSERARVLYADLGQDADLDIIAFNVAVAAWYLRPSPTTEAGVHRTAAPLLERGGHFAKLVARDVALIATDPACIDDLLPRVKALSVLQHDLLQLRARALGGTVQVPDELVAAARADRSTTGLWARHLFAHLDPTHQGLLNDVPELLERISTGLLTGQRDALGELVEVWRSDPVRAAGPL